MKVHVGNNSKHEGSIAILISRFSKMFVKDFLIKTVLSLWPIGTPESMCLITDSPELCITVFKMCIISFWSVIWIRLQTPFRLQQHPNYILAFITFFTIMYVFNLVAIWHSAHLSTLCFLLYIEMNI